MHTVGSELIAKHVWPQFRGKSPCYSGRTANGRPQLLVYDVRDGWDPLCAFLEQDCTLKLRNASLQFSHTLDQTHRWDVWRSDDLGEYWAVSARLAQGASGGSASRIVLTVYEIPKSLNAQLGKAFSGNSEYSLC
eukprot:262023-Amphidinium_carterae.1